MGPKNEVRKQFDVKLQQRAAIANVISDELESLRKRVKWLIIVNSYMLRMKNSIKFFFFVFFNIRLR